MPGRLPLSEINRLGREEFVAALGNLYEHSPWVAEEAWRERPFGSFEELYRAFEGAMYRAPQEKRLSLIRAHPDLAGKAAMAGELTPESKREQASAGLDRLTPEEYEAFTEANRAYRERFGIPLVVYVREHDKASILATAEARLENSREQEIENTLAEISKIARHRLTETIEGDKR